MKRMAKNKLKHLNYKNQQDIAGIIHSSIQRNIPRQTLLITESANFYMIIYPNLFPSSKLLRYLPIKIKK